MPAFRHPDDPGIEDLLSSVIESLDMVIATLEQGAARIAAAIEQRDEAEHYATLERTERQGP